VGAWAKETINAKNDAYHEQRFVSRHIEERQIQMASTKDLFRPTDDHSDANTMGKLGK
jgi:hypothetical protein